MIKRKELKFIINSIEAVKIAEKLKILNKNKEEYKVRSLYFDDFKNSCFYDNKEGLSPREKYRLRLYNQDFSNIYLECKRKEQNLVNKKRQLIEKEQIINILNKNFNFSNEHSEILKNLYIKYKNNLLYPKVILEYDRSAFNLFLNNHNIRITIDKNLKSSYKIKDFLKKDILFTYHHSYDNCILELKYSDIFPEYLYNIIAIDKTQKLSFSKYCYIREFGF